MNPFKPLPTEELARKHFDKPEARAKGVISTDPHVWIVYWPDTNTVRFYNEAGVELRPMGDRLEDGETEASAEEAAVIIHFMSDFLGAQNAIRTDMHNRKIPRSVQSWEELNAVTDANVYLEEAFNREAGEQKACDWCNVLIENLQKWLEHNAKR
jgi:hypothetical protein